MKTVSAKARTPEVEVHQALRALMQWHPFCRTTCLPRAPKKRRPAPECSKGSFSRANHLNLTQVSAQPRFSVDDSFKKYFIHCSYLIPDGRLLWDFLQQLLNDPNQRYTSYIAWKNRESGVFKIVDPAGLAKLWGIQKNHLSMNYDKMSRALRYYYRVNILRKVQGERHCYQFLRNPTELKNIKNISLLRQQMSPTRAQPSQMLQAVKPEPMDEAKPVSATNFFYTCEN